MSTVSMTLIIKGIFGNKEKPGSCLIGRSSEAIFKIFIDRNQIHPVEKRNEYECDNELSDDKSQYHLQVGEAAGLYHTRYGYKRNSGDSGTNHGKGDNIPCRFAVADEEAFVIRFMSCYIGDSERIIKYAMIVIDKIIGLISVA